MRRLLFLFLFFVAVLAASGCSTIHLDASGLITPVKAHDTSLLKETVPAGYLFSEYRMSRKDGATAYGVSVVNPKNTVTVLYYGGSTFTISQHGRRVMDALTHVGMNVVMFDRRGSGMSTGEAALSILGQDALENFHYARSLVEGTLIVHGHSLGSFEACHVAKNNMVDALVLEGSATNAEEWAASRIPWYAKPFIKVTIADNLKTFDNLDVVKNHKAPLLVLVGEKDARTPKVLSKRLFQNSVSQVRELHIFEDGLHEILDHPELGDVYRDFVFKRMTQ